MLTWRGLAIGSALVAAGALGGCGSGSGGGSGDAPTDASKAAFCSTFGAARKVADPHRLGADLRRVGTPADIGPSARHGFEVLVDRLGKLPAHANKGDLSHMAKSLTGTDQTDVVAFITYYARECRGLPPGFSS